MGTHALSNRATATLKSTPDLINRVMTTIKSTPDLINNTVDPIMMMSHVGTMRFSSRTGGKGHLKAKNTAERLNIIRAARPMVEVSMEVNTRDRAEMHTGPSVPSSLSPAVHREAGLEASLGAHLLHNSQ
jgi:hypothetical protein